MRRRRLLWQLYPFFLLVSFLSILVASWSASRSLHRQLLSSSSFANSRLAHQQSDAAVTGTGGVEGSI